MCGIAGFISDDVSCGRSVAGRMTDLIHHRGPDGAGVFASAPAFLGHRRLSIIDVAGGAQPMTNETGDLSIVYNGEIFNHAALRPVLQSNGHTYRTRCDTETILHAYEEWGAACLSRFRGMFAFALWDSRTRTLFCARDRLGIKPLYYFWDGRLFAFASEIKSLLEHPAISARFEQDLLPEYLAFGFTSGDRTLFSGIRQLMPGHCLQFEAGNPASFRIWQYWDVPPGGPANGIHDDREWIAECRRRLEETVSMRLMSDVPLGMFLSGGVDSSAIAALVKRHADGPVKTFSVGYADARYSELSYARQVAAAIGTEHHEIVIGPDDFFDALPRLVWHEDEPVTWPSSVSLYFVSKLAARDVKVVLTGEGADELFAGYHRYRTYLLNQRLAGFYSAAVPAGLRARVRRFVENSPLLSGPARRKIGHTFLAREGDFPSLYLENFFAAFSRAGQAALLLRTPSCASLDEYLHHWESSAGRSLLDRMLYADQKTYLVELLRKQDRMSMACSIESRVPLLDHCFVEFAASVPAGLKIRGRTGKYIFKKAVEDLLPREIIYRRKMGFPTPIRAWLRGPGAERLLAPLTDPHGFLAEYLNLEELRALLDRHRRGVEDATDRIWRLLNLRLWAEIFLEGRSPSPGV